MKLLVFTLTIIVTGFLSIRPACAQFGSIGDIIQNKVDEKVNQKAEEKTDEAMDSLLQNHPKGEAETQSHSNTPPGGSGGASATPATAENFSVYNNYDFKPGENIIFEDHFAVDQ